MNAKKKGNKWERRVATWLTSWTGYKFERNRAGSGSWWSNKDAVSDITCTDERHAHRCKISIECKSYKDIRFEHVLLGNKTCDIVKFWEQASRDASRSHKVPILCMRYNSMPKDEFFLVVDASLAPAFYRMMSETYMTLNISGLGYLMVFMASKVKDLVDYKDLHREAKKLLKN
jgi:Holliday junction resolvase